MSKLLKNIIAVLIFVMTAAIFVQVLTRYVLHVSLPFLQMVIAFSMSWLTMLGAALGLESGKHFAIDLFSEKESTPFLKAIQIIKEIMILTVIVSLIYGGWKFSLIGLKKEEPSTGLPEIYTFSSVLGGSIFMLIYFVKKKICQED